MPMHWVSMLKMLKTKTLVFLWCSQAVWAPTVSSSMNKQSC